MIDIFNLALTLMTFVISLIFSQRIGALALNTNDNFYLTFSFGVVINILAICTLSTISNNYAKSFYIICFLNFILFFKNFSWRNFTNFYRAYHNEVFLISLLFIFFYIFNTYYWYDNHKYYMNEVDKFFGTLHTPKYANIIAFIHEENRLPFINQSLGQSLMTYSLSWNNENFYQSLKIFLAISQSFFFAFAASSIKPLFKKHFLDFCSWSMLNIIIL